MALATQCPHCGTTFRVAQDQLKLRAGLVRCGACKQIFNGVEHLLHPGGKDAARAAEPAPSPGTPNLPASASDATSTPPAGASEGLNHAARAEPEAAMPDPAATAFEAQNKLGSASADPDPGSFDLPSDRPGLPSSASGMDQAPREFQAQQPQGAFRPAPSATVEPTGDDPLLRMTLMDFSDPDDEEEEAPSPAFGNTRIAALPEGSALIRQPSAHADSGVNDDGESDELSRAIDALQSRPWQAKSKRGWRARPPSPDDDSEEMEPGFVVQARRQQRLSRPLRIAMKVAMLLLLSVALLQAVYVFRDQLAARFPQTVPVLTQFCEAFDCQVGLPMQTDALSIESSELQALETEENRFALIALLRNNGATVQAWPHIQLTLNDGNETAVVRRVFSPRDYAISEPQRKAGIDAASEHAIKITFELSDLKASGYRVYLFYP